MADKSQSLSYLLAVAAPSYASGVDIQLLERDTRLFKSVAGLARRNGLCYHLISRVTELGLQIPPSEEAGWAEEKERLLKFKDTLLLLNKVTREKKIDYLVIKACSAVPHIPRDVDIFVRGEDRAAMLEALEATGLKSVQTGAAETALTGAVLRIDIYTRLCYVNVDFLEPDFLWQSAAAGELFGVRFPSPSGEASFLLLLVHSIFGHRSMTLLDFLHMRHLRDGIDINRCRGYAAGQGWGGAFDLALKNLDGVEEKIRGGKSAVAFPYWFGRGFVLECLSGVKTGAGGRNRLLLEITLAQDYLLNRLVGTPLYRLVWSFAPARNLINSLTALTKSLRGDKKSLE